MALNVRATTRRSQLLTLLQSFSMEFKSGEYGGKYHTLASTASMISVASGDL